MVGSLDFPYTDNHEFNYFPVFSTKLLQISNVETSDFSEKTVLFLRSVVFLHSEREVVQNCCFEVNEQSLTFQEHQKLLESSKDSWRNLEFSD